MTVAVLIMAASIDSNANIVWKLLLLKIEYHRILYILNRFGCVRVSFYIRFEFKERYKINMDTHLCSLIFQNLLNGLHYS